MSFSFRNLVFEGGGVKSIAYLGTLEVLEEKGILSEIECIGGTSGGAINAILLGLGYDQATTREILWSLDFNKFMDDSLGVARDFNRLINEFGWHKGDCFPERIGSVIKDKTRNIEPTFANIEAMKNADNGFKSRYFIGTDLSTTSSEVFSAEHTPRLCVSDAHLAHEAIADKLNVVLTEPVSCSGKTVIEKVFHIQHVNAYLSTLKTWISRTFRSVATKYLCRYRGWRHPLRVNLLICKVFVCLRARSLTTIKPNRADNDNWTDNDMTNPAVDFIAEFCKAIHMKGYVVLLLLLPSILFLPDLTVSFGLLKYQETIKPRVAMLAANKYWLRNANEPRNPFKQGF